MTLLATVGGPRTLWYLTRGTGVVSLLLLTAGVVLGVLGPLGSRAPRRPRFLLAGLHRSVTLLAVAFVTAHVVTTVADGFAPIGLKDAIVPFLSPYRPVWLGLGAVAFDLLLALVATSLLRARIGLRAWRAVHWLAYASWPIALVHTLGTGSDVHAGWLQLLAAASTLAVVAAVLARVLTAPAATPGLRLTAGAAALATAVAIAAWTESGPLARGWAARAGTPSTLLAPAVRTVATRPTGSRAATSSPSSGRLPSGAFTASLRGRIRESAAGSGLVVVSIDGRTHGGFAGRVHVALRGEPLAGGGVALTDSAVGLLPAGASEWSAGRVLALSGTRILAGVQAPGGRGLRVLLDVRVDARTGSVTGTLSGAGGQERE